jgi:hypothetical protein
MSKRIESSKVGYVQRAYFDKQWASLHQRDDSLTDNGIFDQVSRRKRDAQKYAQEERIDMPEYPSRDFDVRRVRVTLIVEDITDWEAEA